MDEVFGKRRVEAVHLLGVTADAVATADLPPGSAAWDAAQHLRFARYWPWTDLIISAIQRLAALPNPG
ncbi:hypothetical protein OHA59_49650 [Streptomyces sp. NBC_01589]|uniref:hypothetical protein n=1 Tax=Streptomyces sp. NBC_01589 TaxID=2975886 RepID=UPI00386351ED